MSAVIELLESQIRESRGLPFLSLQLATHSDRRKSEVAVVIPLVHTREAFTIAAARLTLMPNMPACVMGLLGHRSRVFWAIDLAQLLGYAPLDPTAVEYNLVLLQSRDSVLAIAVRQVNGVVRFLPETVRSPETCPDLNTASVAFLQGMVTLDGADLLVLDADAIARATKF